MQEERIADKYLRIYQKLCLLPFGYALLSLVSTFIAYADESIALTLSFYLIRGLHLIPLQLIYLWIIGIAITLVFLFLSAYGAKGRWKLLIIPTALGFVDMIYGIFLYGAMTPLQFFLGLAMHILFLIGMAFTFIYAYKTTKALKAEVAPRP